MSRQRLVRPIVIACALSAMGACGRRDVPSQDSLPDTVATTADSADTIDWVSDLGTLLVVPSDSDHTGIILFPPAPDPRLIASAPLAFFSPAGDSLAASARLVVSDSQVCGEAPTIQLREGEVSAWTVGLMARAATPIRTDSIEGMPSADSARFAADLARLASTLPPVRESRFGGLPFVVLSARRFQTDDGHAVVAHLVRRLPQEATPLEEHTFVLAERPTLPPGAPYVVRHQRRSEGTEETADHFELLAVLSAGDGMYVLVAREREASTTYEVLQRTRNRNWRVRWSRTLAC
jgi:hypothetical protein